MLNPSRLATLITTLALYSDKDSQEAAASDQQTQGSYGSTVLSETGMGPKKMHRAKGKARHT